MMGFAGSTPYALNLLLEPCSFAFMRKPTVLTTRPAQVICPSGCLLSSLISDFPKDISVPTYPKSRLELSPSRPTEGRIRIVRDAGWDAVDAAAFCTRRDCRAGWPKACERSTS